MICKTDKPPSNQEPGNPPEFLGNVTKLHATVHPSRSVRLHCCGFCVMPVVVAVSWVCHR